MAADKLEKTDPRYRKVKRYLKIVNDSRYRTLRKIENIFSRPCDYKTNNVIPTPEECTPFTYGGTWGSGSDSHAWFVFDIPAAGEDTFMRVSTGNTGWDATNPQFIAYFNGKIVQGLDVNHTDILLPAGEDLKAALYGYTGPKIAETRLFVTLVQLNAIADKLYYDLLYPFQMLEYLDTEGDEYAQILSALYRTVSLLELYDVGSSEFTESMASADDYLEREFYSKCEPGYPVTACIGHTHIDCAWKWTLKQTREKVQRSFATVLELMRRYPEYKFMSSQAFLYQNLKEEAPELYEEVRRRIAEGRWECEGAMWVEADCNLSSGESLIRQVVYGKDYFRREFGKENRVLWLPDVFGYSAALPQILRKCNVDWFVTSKISWNDVNRMPYDTFSWRGIDGTSVNSFFLTPQNSDGQATQRKTTYVGKTDAQMINGTYRRYSQKNLNREALLTYGFGDGGGGPTSEHIELLRRASRGIPGSPTAEPCFAGDFLSRLEANIKENESELPVWNGELYLEFHRGTYTSQARNKKNNRRSEFLYLQAEWLSEIAKNLLGTSPDTAALRKGWEMILTNQFHDIIPGSSIREVYEQCGKDYAKIFETGNGISGKALNAIAAAADKKDGWVVFNPTSFAGTGRVTVDGESVFADNIPSKGYRVTDRFRRGNNVLIEGKHVLTGVFDIEFDDSMNMRTLTDRRTGRQLLTGPGNSLEIYADYPDAYDAWEWQEYSREAHRVINGITSLTEISDGIRRGFEIKRSYMSSVITQKIWFYDRLPQIDFETEVDWHEKHKMLKAAFPTDINSDSATYEIQFGCLRRPTHFNTSWDRQKFEVCAQKYADLSDGSCGISIINDCKYGHDIHGGVIRLSLLRCATDPDPDADQGAMSFSYSLCPHVGQLDTDTLRAAYLLNNPMFVVRASGDTALIPGRYSAVSADKDNLICETVKQAEDGSGTVFRIYEALNRVTDASVALPEGSGRVFLCDMEENPISELPLADGRFRYTFRGFEIATFRAVRE